VERKLRVVQPSLHVVLLPSLKYCVYFCVKQRCTPRVSTTVFCVVSTANRTLRFVIILQCIPSVSITAGVPTYTISLGLVLLFDGIVTAREDYKRHKDDNAANSRCAPYPCLPRTAWSCSG
jgi:hypothetical protein